MVPRENRDPRSGFDQLGKNAEQGKSRAKDDVAVPQPKIEYISDQIDGVRITPNRFQKCQEGGLTSATWGAKMEVADEVGGLQGLSSRPAYLVDDPALIRSWARLVSLSLFQCAACRVESDTGIFGHRLRAL